MLKNKKLTPLEKAAETRKIMKNGYAAKIDDLIDIINYNADPFAIANNSFNFGYYQGVLSTRVNGANPKKEGTYDNKVDKYKS